MDGNNHNYSPNRGFTRYEASKEFVDNEKKYKQWEAILVNKLNQKYGQNGTI